jgi:anthranilate 1,2-dioxygenase ferredoxin reductase component
MNRIVIVGAGLAGFRAAEAARDVDPSAVITLLGDEGCAPYSRPPLSKEFLRNGWTVDQLLVRPAAWYQKARVALHTNTTAISINLRGCEVHLADGRTLVYDRLILATGSRPRELIGSEIDTSCVNVLRTEGDARHIRDRLNSRASLIIIGGGVIGLELAASARCFGCQVTVLEAGSRLMARCVPTAVSSLVERLHASQAVEVACGAKIVAVHRAAGKVIVSANLGVFAADIVVAGIGVIPNTELASTAGLHVDDGVVVDESGRSSDPQVYAAGEVTRHFNPTLCESVRLECWQVADRQAAVAGSTAAGKPKIFNDIPWFWSDQYDTNLQVLGSFVRATTITHRPSSQLGSETFLGLDDQYRLVGAACINRGRDISALKRLIAVRSPLEPQALADPESSFREMLTTGVGSRFR